jgi:phage-Barnase-EndoU-ColicinE5/D-RelE like nuclease2
VGASKDFDMSLISDKPTRPPTVEYLSIRDVYLQFDEIFLAGRKSLIVSPCGHKIYCFEHHFFHMTGVIVGGLKELSMPHERDTILNTTHGFAHYDLREKGSRVRHLRSARETLENPDEIWADNPRVLSAKWVYIKEYHSKPYAFSVALVGVWEAN